jgi:ADP-heptose:LPS heptosyltransferase
VISVDTAIAHLAGGAGRPVDLLLGNPADWRWRQFENNDQLWYPDLQTWPLNAN